IRLVTRRRVAVPAHYSRRLEGACAGSIGMPRVRLIVGRARRTGWAGGLRVSPIGMEGVRAEAGGAGRGGARGGSFEGMAASRSTGLGGGEAVAAGGRCGIPPRSWAQTPPATATTRADTPQAIAGTRFQAGLSGTVVGSPSAIEVRTMAWSVVAAKGG